jgi:hypothetical protein
MMLNPNFVKFGEILEVWSTHIHSHTLTHTHTHTHTNTHTHTQTHIMVSQVISCL